MLFFKTLQNSQKNESVRLFFLNKGTGLRPLLFLKEQLQYLFPKNNVSINNHQILTFVFRRESLIVIVQFLRFS